MKTIQQMVQQELHCNVSSLVSTLASGYGTITHNNKFRAELFAPGLPSLCEQAWELAAPVPDYEEAARQAGWNVVGDMFAHGDEAVDHVFPTDPAAWETLCEGEGLAPYDREVFEHWAVSQWLAEKLIEQGEKVDTDFASLNVWARTATGQQISADAVIERIYTAMMAPVEG